MAGSQPLLLPVRHSGGHTGEPAVMLSGKGLGFSFHSGGSGGAVGDLEGLGHLLPVTVPSPCLTMETVEPNHSD